MAASQKAQAKNMKTALLVGGGLIGFSFAQRFVGAGWQVRMTDVRAELADAVAQEFGDKVRFSTNLEDLTDSVDFVQEAGLESLEFKHKIFARLAGLTDAAILASSTSAILPSKSAADNPAAERIVIGHPFTPPALMPVLEVVPGPETAPETVERALEVYRELGFEPSAMKKEIPGFVGNRIQKVDMWEAISLVQQGGHWREGPRHDFAQLAGAALRGHRPVRVQPFGRRPRGHQVDYRTYRGSLGDRACRRSARHVASRRGVRASRCPYGNYAETFESGTRRRNALLRGFLDVRAAH